MAQNIDTILQKLRELQATLPAVEGNVQRLQALMKVAFETGSASSIAAVNVELNKMSQTALDAYNNMSNLDKARASFETLKSAVHEVNVELEKTARLKQSQGLDPAYTNARNAEIEAAKRAALPKTYQADPVTLESEMARLKMMIQARQSLSSGAFTIGGISPEASNAAITKQIELVKQLQAAPRTQFEAEWAQGQAEAMAQVTANLEAQKVALSQVTQAQNTQTAAVNSTVTAEEAAAQAAKQAADQKRAALDSIITKQREAYGVGQSGQFFTQREMVENIRLGAGGTRNLRSMTGGEDASTYFKRMLGTGEIAQNPNNAYQYKFTELNTRDLEAFRQALLDQGAALDEVNKKTQEYAQGKRLISQTTGPAAATTKADTEAIRIQNLQQTGLRSLFGSDEQYTKFQDRLGQLKIGLGDVKRATTDVASGITTINFDTLDEATGVMRTATIYVDEFGRAITQGTSKVRTLEEMITGNINKVLLWAVALGAVYGSLQKIGELVQSMQKIQDALVDITITTNATVDGLNQVYDAVVNISQATATDLTGSLTAFNQALRATGGIGNEGQRISTSLKLLTDSLTLAKLAGLDTKRAMDLLIAGLKQLDQPLDSGAQLLDKFQAISNQANSSVEDMATTFAITAGAASDVGVNVNNLVALIGAFSEATSLSATETGNALRAMFSNFTQPQAIETLNKYGIAVQDINGEFKSFIDVFQQASELARSGVLSERQVAEIANALGGGSRRQAQVTALLTVAPRQQSLKEFLDQGKEAGAAQDALEQKTSTVSSAMERLQNSFDNLAKSLGTSGGFLDALTTMVNLLTKVIDLASELTKALGPGLPLLLAGVAGYSLIKGQGPVLGKFGGQIAGALGSPTANLGSLGNGIGADAVGSGFVKSLISSGTEFGRNAFQSMLPILPLLAGSISESAQSGDWTKTIGMGAGAAFMGVISGNPIWALVGGLIGQGIATEIQNQQKTREAASAALGTTPTTVPEKATAKDIEETINKARANLTALAGADQDQVLRRITAFQERLRGINSDESLKAATEAFMAQRSKGLSASEAYAQLQQTPMTLPGHPGVEYTGSTAGFTQATLERAAQEMSLTERLIKAVESVANLPADMQEALKRNSFVAVQEAFMGSPAGIKSATASGDIIGTAEYEYNRKKRFEFTEQLTKGDLTPSDYNQRMTSLTSSGLVATNILSSLNPNITKDSVKAYGDEWLRIKDIVTNTEEGTQNYLSKAASDLSTMKERLVELRTQQELYKRGLSSLDSEGYTKLITQIEDATVQTDLLTKQMYALLDAAEAAANASKFTFKGFTDYSKYSNEEMKMLIQQARGLQDLYSQQTNTPLDQLIKTAPDIVTMTKEGFQTWGGVYQQFLDQVLANVDEFKNKMEEKMKFNFKSLRNVPAEMAQRLQQAMNYYTNLLKNYGFNEKNEAITVLFKDNQVGQLIGSQTALQLALEDLTEVEKKKLDGVYNLPSGATAFIPLQAGQLLSEYTNNTMGASNVNYGATPTTPPAVGSYPLGKPPSEMTTEELLRKFLAQATPLQEQAKAVGQIKYPGWSPEGYKLEDRPYWEKYSMDKLNGTTAPTADIAKLATSNANTIQQVVNSLESTIGKLSTNILSIFGAKKSSGSDIFLPSILKDGDIAGHGRSAGLASPIKININQEKQTHEVNVQMAINLDARRIWEGIRRVAMADYARMTASVGESERSRGNVI